ncbi:MAG: hypothetical protein GXX78_10190 [Bacteroidales bacterium]|nr:hypothetical protein [Bacteroidales bacterium]HPB06575.1 hypothetical protein [Prolixibacteraceae bacterium]
MNIAITIKVIALVALCAIPISLILLSINRKKKQTKKELFAFANESKCTISQSDSWGTTCIGIDETNKILFFAKKPDVQPIKISLCEVTQCKLIPEHYKNGDSKTGQPSAQHIFLELTLSIGLQQKIMFEFYNLVQDFNEFDGRYHLASKWQKIITTYINSKQ